jgi:hypothetical protein
MLKSLKKKKYFEKDEKILRLSFIKNFGINFIRFYVINSYYNIILNPQKNHSILIFNNIYKYFFVNFNEKL